MSELSTRETKFGERLERVMKAVALEPVDRIPVVLEYAGFAARVTGTDMSDFLASTAYSVEVMKTAYQLVAEAAEADAVNYGSMDAYTLPFIFGAKVKVPGVDLGANDDWQMAEQELMSEDDYDRILEMGWPEWWMEFLTDRIFDDTPRERNPLYKEAIDIQGPWAEIGVPVLMTQAIAPPLEILCGARSLNRFAFDLLNRPEKLDRVMEAMQPHLVGPTVEHAREAGQPMVWVGGWRAAPSMLSPQMWSRFAWPYLKQACLDLIKAGLTPLLHLDSNWTRELARFKELPPGKMVLALDGVTDIFEAKRVLNGHSCLMGDVPAAMLAFDSPDTVGDYCRRLIKEVGPEGFILQSGCDIPNNAKLECVQRMVASVFE